MKVITHYIAVVIGAVVGFMAAAILNAGNQVEITRCRDCKHARIEKHAGDERLVCWRRGPYGYVVESDGYCDHSERRVVDDDR